MTADAAKVASCFARKIGAWFEHEGVEPTFEKDENWDEVEGPTSRSTPLPWTRQANETIADVASTWSEIGAATLGGSGAEACVQQMLEWFDSELSRAKASDENARAQALDEARLWLETCVRLARSPGEAPASVS